MKICFNFTQIVVFLSLLIGLPAYAARPDTAANLLQVYQQALTSDPTFQQAVAQRLSTKQGVPISLSAILPNLSVSMNPAVTRYGYAGTNYVNISNFTSGTVGPRNLTQRTYTLDLSLSQTVFNVAQFAAIGSQFALSKSADATLNAALQDLMIRTANAYFTVLNDEENVSYSEATVAAYAEQLRQIRLQYKVGIKTLTDVYTAQASYDSSTANLIAAQTTLANDKENLRVITGVKYTHLSKLSEQLPLAKPHPADAEKWVDTAIRQNWQIKTTQYNASSARQVVVQQFAGHLPTVTMEGSLQRQYQQNINGYQTLNVRNGPGTTSQRSIGFNINLPLFEGGGVIAQTSQAKDNYDIALQQMELAIRTTASTTRQTYLNVVSGISKINADAATIKSTISSLHGLEASYRVGTETLVNVLDQQQKVYQAQTQYASDRYAFIMNQLLLKQAAGTLSYQDLHIVNGWLDIA